MLVQDLKVLRYKKIRNLREGVEWRAQPGLDPYGDTIMPSCSAASEVELCAELKCAATGGTRDLAEATAVPRQPSRAAAVGSEEELRRICHAKCLEAQV